eukprot:TRINITY_DN9292_c0_g1_i1.p1 TRINITY_DN9292_c0_g1~~TRINITY_DN9292_c0_g1_i1.p1  ORF type:complete len:154 (-),score=12.78 TRINITY_DN9292_c0_g1_i1:2-463(-)
MGCAVMMGVRTLAMQKQSQVQAIINQLEDPPPTTPKPKPIIPPPSKYIPHPPPVNDFLPPPPPVNNYVPPPKTTPPPPPVNNYIPPPQTTPRPQVPAFAPTHAPIIAQPSNDIEIRQPPQPQHTSGITCPQIPHAPLGQCAGGFRNCWSLGVP